MVNPTSVELMNKAVFKEETVKEIEKEKLASHMTQQNLLEYVFTFLPTESSSSSLCQYLSSPTH